MQDIFDFNFECDGIDHEELNDSDFISAATEDELVDRMLSLIQ